MKTTPTRPYSLAACSALFVFWAGLTLAAAVSEKTAASLPVVISVDFSRTLQDWDGFGVNYVQTRHTRDYEVFDQDYGGMKYLNDLERRQLIDLVFGDEGLQPAIIKCFLDPFHEPVNDNDDPFVIDAKRFNHEKTTGYMRFFLEEGLRHTRKRQQDLVVLAGLYGPPDWMSSQRTFRGRDLDPAMTAELAEYLVAWTLYLKENMGATVRYISMHNEGEAYNRWTDDGKDHPSHYGHDYNMFWRDHQVAEFIVAARAILDHHGLHEVGITTGEPAIWSRLYEYSPHQHIQLAYAESIVNNPEAMASLGLITSHGFDYGGNQFDDRAIRLLRQQRPELHAWTTSCTWGTMSLDIVEQARGYLYLAANNALIPWATVHNRYESDKLSPPAGFRISGNANSPIMTHHGVLETTKAYYFYKQLTRAGRPGMKVAFVDSSDPDSVSALAWSAHGTGAPDAFIVVNKHYEPTEVKVRLKGVSAAGFQAHYTQDFGAANYSVFRDFKHQPNEVSLQAPERSVITFLVK